MLSAAPRRSSVWQFAGAGALALSAVAAAVVLCSSNPNPVTREERTLFHRVDVPAPVAAALRTSCADCHSNDTHWPWYSHLPGVSAWVGRDVRDARRHFNLSDWQTLESRGPEETAAGFSGICENLISGAMPLHSYLLLHPAARVTPVQREQVCSWANARQMDLLRRASLTAPSSPGTP